MFSICDWFSATRLAGQALSIHLAPLGAPFLVLASQHPIRAEELKSNTQRISALQFFDSSRLHCCLWPLAKARLLRCRQCLPKKSCSCAAGGLFLVSFVALARANELVRGDGGENHHSDACTSICDYISAGLMWCRAPAAARPSPGRARARASWPRSPDCIYAVYRLMQ